MLVHTVSMVKISISLSEIASTDIHVAKYG